METLLREDELVLPSCRIGGVDPCPALRPLRHGRAWLGARDPRISPEEQKHFGYGIGEYYETLAYPIQNQYDRSLSPRKFKTLVLENRFLKATFLPEFGGRLISLFSKSRERELLYVNSVFRLGNLSARDAWFSGGIEWNISIQGHSPLTCDDMFAASVRTPDGFPILRFYEYERTRGIYFQLDFILPPDSNLLYTAVRINNPHAETVPAYWWSNIAVPEYPETRVLAPAEKAFRSAYIGGIDLVDIPLVAGNDVSYPSRIPQSADYFYRLDDQTFPWIASLDRAGVGLFQASTPLLRGRKLFAWGRHVGGQRWQEFLTVPESEKYCEIQAGLARTQYETLPMPPQADWRWVEAYGMIEVDAAKSHSSDWNEAVSETERAVRLSINPEKLASFLEDFSPLMDEQPDQILHSGAGWGALEQKRRRKAGEPHGAPSSMLFPDASLGPLQEPWMRLLEDGHLPSMDPSSPPLSWMSRDEWLPFLEQSDSSSRKDWQSSYLKGLIHWAQGRDEEACHAWRESRSMCRNPWAARCLAVAAEKNGKVEEAFGLWQEACGQVQNVFSIHLEYGESLLRHGRADLLQPWMETLPEGFGKHPRIRLLLVRAKLEAGELDTAEQLLDPTIVPANLAEGDTELSDLWFILMRKRKEEELGRHLTEAEAVETDAANPPPVYLDFRQNIAASFKSDS